ncbi:hypothetical protein VTN96DRAFT_1288 [Rasamsonia emersonii]
MAGSRSNPVEYTEMREIKQSFISPLSQSSIQLSDSDEDLSSGTEYVPSDIDEEKEYERLETQTKEPINDDLFVDPSLGSHTVSFTMQAILDGFGPIRILKKHDGDSFGRSEYTVLGVIRVSEQDMRRNYPSLLRQFEESENREGSRATDRSLFSGSGFLRST